MANSFGGIISTEEYISYANCVVEAMKTGMYKYIAHPDLIMMSPFPVDDNVRKALDIIIDCVVKNDYIVEYNVNGLRRGQREYREGPRYPYPYNPFWEEIAKTRAKVIIGADCHSPRLLNDSYVKMAEDDVKRLNLNIITDIDI